MRHGVCSPARSFAALDASVAVDNGRDFHITILRAGKPEETYVERFAGDLEASFDAIVRGGEGAVLLVRPLIESTYGEGMSAYPRDLHRDANSAAQAGWHMAQADEQRRQTERRALQFVMRQPSIEATVWGAA